MVPDSLHLDRGRAAAFLYALVVPLGSILLPARLGLATLPGGESVFLIGWALVVATGAATLAAGSRTPPVDSIPALIAGVSVAVGVLAGTAGTDASLLVLAAVAAVVASLGAALGAVAVGVARSPDGTGLRGRDLAISVTTVVALAVFLRAGWEVSYWLGLGLRFDGTLALTVAGIGLVVGLLATLAARVDLRAFLSLVVAFPLVVVLVTVPFPPFGSIGSEWQVVLSLRVVVATGFGAIGGWLLRRRLPDDGNEADDAVSPNPSSEE